MVDYGGGIKKNGLVVVGEGLEDDGSVNVGFADEESRERVGYLDDVLTMLETPCGHDAVASYAVVVVLSMPSGISSICKSGFISWMLESSNFANIICA